MTIPQKINQLLTGNSDPCSLNLKRFFNGIFQSKKNPNPIQPLEVPFPTIWKKVMLGMLVLATILLAGVTSLGPYPFPWLTMVMAALVPVTLVLFVYEFNNAQPVPIRDLLIVFFIGSAASFYVVGDLGIWTGIEIVDLIFNACVEELAKLAPIYLAIRFLKIKRASAALLVGLTVGAGFDIAESMGYSTFYGLEAFFENGEIDFSTMVVRLQSAFMSHTLWGGMEGAALIFAVRGEPKKPRIGTLMIWIGFAMITHILWNMFGGMIVGTVIQLLFIPVFLYLLDACYRDQLEAGRMALLEAAIETPGVALEDSKETLEEEPRKNEETVEETIASESVE